MRVTGLHLDGPFCYPVPSKDSYFKAFGPKDPIMYGFLGYFDAKGTPVPSHIIGIVKRKRNMKRQPKSVGLDVEKIRF